jgi:hypothetical protein
MAAGRSRGTFGRHVAVKADDHRDRPTTTGRRHRQCVIVLGPALLLAACGGTFSGSTLSQQVTNWAKSTSFSSELSTVQGDIRRIDAVVDQSEQGSLKTDCDLLVQDALMANQNLPSPDLKLTNLLSTAYAEAGEAGHDCLFGAGGGRLLTRSVGERITARMDLIKALARFDSVTS